jgi:hypothetical protein
MKKIIFLVVGLLLVGAYAYTQESKYLSMPTGTSSGYDYGANKFYPIGVDINGSVITTEIDHWIVHKGASYTVSGFVTVPASDVKYFQIKNTTSGGTHLRGFHFVSTQGNAKIEIYEGTTVTSDGEALTVINQNRNFVNGAEVAVFKNTSTSADGTFLTGDLLVGSKQSGGALNQEVEWILKEDIIYTFKYTNIATSNDDIHFDFWFLETNLL